MRCATRRQLLNLAPHAIAVAVLVLGASFASAQADISVGVSWEPNCDPCEAGQRLTITNTVTNGGPSPDANVTLQLAAPYLGMKVVEDSWTTSQGSFDVDPDTGEVLIFDDAAPAYFFTATLGVMTPNSTATLTYDVDLDAEAPPVQDIRVDSPAALAGVIDPFGTIGQDADGNTWYSVPPWYEWNVTATAQVADDGSTYPTAGCSFPWVDFVPGNIALVRRGPLPPGTACQFGTKAYNAELSGASGVIIMDHEDGDPNIPPGMAPGDFGGEVTIPVISITKALGDALEAAIAGGETVTISMNVRPQVEPGQPWVVSSEELGYPSNWAWGTNDPNCCPPSDPDFPTCCNASVGTNNLVYFAINVAPSGQPTAPVAGFTFAPAAPLAGETVTFTNTTTGTAPVTYAWDFGDGATSTDMSPTHAYAAAGTYTVTLTATNAAGSDTATQDVTVTAGAVAPVAGFTWTAAGLDATFTNTTTGTAPITYAWDFGDGGTSTDLNPTYTYAVAGTYTVTLVATNSEGSDTATDDVTVTADVQLDEFYFVAAAANAEGAAGSFFVTDVEINNPGTTAMSYRFLWLPRDTDNSNPTASDVFTLAAGASVRYQNVLNEVFAAEDVVGALAIVADSPDAIIMSRTFNQGDAGTFGQAIEGLHSSELIQAGERMRVVFMTETDPADTPATGYRSNLGLLNGTGAPLTVMVARYDAEGTMLGDMATVELDPWENTQLNRVLRNFDPPVAGYIDVWTETTDGAFAAYGSVLDNVTSDPTTVNPK